MLGLQRREVNRKHGKVQTDRPARPCRVPLSFKVLKAMAGHYFLNKPRDCLKRCGAVHFVGVDAATQKHKTAQV